MYKVAGTGALLLALLAGISAPAQQPTFPSPFKNPVLMSPTPPKQTRLTTADITRASRPFFQGRTITMGKQTVPWDIGRLLPRMNFPSWPLRQGVSTFPEIPQPKK
jgi:hypothetical protein